MTLGFKTQIKGKPTGFVDKILAGEKVTTIREDKKNRWKPKTKIHFATGVRTKNYKQFAEGECTKVEQIAIRYLQPTRKTFGESKKIDNALHEPHVYVNGDEIKGDKLEKLAKEDGFDSVENFFEWFKGDFIGKIIHFKTI